MWAALFALIAVIVRYLLARRLDQEMMTAAEWGLVKEAHEQAIKEAKGRLRCEYDAARRRVGDDWFDHWRGKGD